jgi:hypothetical protein
MISFVVRLKFTPEDRAEIAETMRLLATASRQEPGCVTYIPHHVEDDPDTVLIYTGTPMPWPRTAPRNTSRSTPSADFTRGCGSGTWRTWLLSFDPPPSSNRQRIGA